MRLAFPFRRRAALSHSDGRRRDTRALAFAAGLGWALLADLASASELPRICAPCAGGVTWAAPGSASSYVVKGAHGVVRQRNERETFDWASFNLSRDASLEFKQPDASAVALNRIHQASASEIFGALKANGQIYLINQNGVLFKSGAKVDVNTLLASSLGLNEAVGNLFEQVGLVDAFKQTGKPAALTAPAGVTPGAVKVEAGAELSAAKNGRVILAGGAVSNAGTIKVSGIGGQALLIAAKDKVYVVTSSEQGVRGLAVEVGVGGTVENVGRILAEQGNVTLAGLTVNQNGIVRATTAVSANGSIRLQAQDLNGRAPDPTDGNAVPLPTRAGQVTIGAGSRSEVMTVEDSATTGVDDLEQLAGRIQVRAKDIAIGRGAALTAPGGKIELTASGNPQSGGASADGSISIARGAKLDVAGSSDAVVSVTRNIASLELRGNELADSPVQRGGPLFGKVVHFDIRRPPKIARVEAALQNVPRNVQERTAIGGSITLTAGKRVDLASGAVLDVSGGQVQYTGAYIETTRLVKDGAIVDIADANPLVSYDAVLGPLAFKHPKWGERTTELFKPFGATDFARYEAGYIEGKDAGSIVINGLAAGQVVEGQIAATFRATTQRGLHQRVPTGGVGGLARAYDQLPQSGSLELTLNSGSLSYGRDGWPFALEGIERLKLAVDNFSIEPGAELRFGPGSRLDVSARLGADIQGQVRMPGGTLDIKVDDFAPTAEESLRLGRDARLDVSGTFVNDSRLLHPQGNNEIIDIDAGSISLTSGGALELTSGSRLDVSGGLRLTENGTRDIGDGGSLTLTTRYDESLTEFPRIDLTGAFSGYVFAGGGAHTKLNITMPTVRLGVGPTRVVDGVLLAGVDLLAGRGFTDIALTAQGGTIGVAPGSRFRLQPRYLDLLTYSSTPSLASRDTTAGLAAPIAIDDADLRTPTALKLIAKTSTVLAALGPGQSLAPLIDIARGVDIATDNLGSLSLVAPGAIAIRGALHAAGGSIDINMGPVQDSSGAADRDAGYDNKRAITLYDGAQLDVAGATVANRRLSSKRVFSNSGLRASRALAGGKITLTASEGFVIGGTGSMLDVDGAHGVTLAAREAGNGAIEIGAVATTSDAGSVSITASNGIQLFSTLSGDAGLGAAGGRLRLALDGNLRRTNLDLSGTATRFPETALRVMVDEQARPSTATDNGVDSALFGRADFALEALRAGGFDYLDLAAAPNLRQRGLNTSGTPPDVVPLMEARVEFLGAPHLEFAGGVTLDAPIIASDGGHARVDSAYLRLGFSRNDMVTSDDPAQDSSPEIEPAIKYFSPSAGRGTVSFAADLIDVVGFTSFRGFGNAATAIDLNSRGDIRLQGVRSPHGAFNAGIDGVLAVAANTRLRAERIYPTTLSQFQIINTASGASTTFSSPRGAMTGQPASAGGSLTVTSDRIAQLGNVLAPHGQITLDGDRSVVLGADSLTSVTGSDSTILFGRTEVGDWIFPFDNAAYVFLNDPGVAANRYAPPVKRITLLADGSRSGGAIGEVDVRRGAVVDLRGGGTLRATEFVPGPGGSKDLLDAADALHAGILQQFALVPSEHGLAPSDPLETPAFDFSITRQVRIHDGVEGIAPGVYAVLPPRYALLPGAYLLSRAGAFDASLAAGTGSETNAARALHTAHGLPVVSTSFQGFGLGASALPTDHYQVEDGTQVRSRAEYRETDANKFFAHQAERNRATAPLLPLDAGVLQLSPNAVLKLGGSLAFDPRHEGLGASVDISANDIFISNSGRGGTGVNVRAADLEALNADSILIGGARNFTGSTVSLGGLIAHQVVVDDGVRLSVPELSLVARERVEVGEGTELKASGRRVAPTAEIDFDGAGALIRVSTAQLPGVVRTNVPAVNDAQAIVGEGAKLAGRGSVIVDSSGTTTLVGDLVTGAGGGLRLGAQQIALGLPPDAAPGLHLDEGRLAKLRVSDLVLASILPIDLYGAFDLSLQHLEIDAPGIRGNVIPQVGGDIAVRGVIRAESIVLGNTSGRSSVDPGVGSGSLLLTSLRGKGAPLELSLAHTANLTSAPGDDGDFDILGLSEATFDAPLVHAVGDHRLQVAGNLTVAANIIAADSGHTLALGASGAFETHGASRATVRAPQAVNFAGGAVQLSGRTLKHDTRVLTPSGSATLSASGGDLQIMEHGEIDAAGLSNLDFKFARFATPGGSIKLVAEHGNLRIDAGAELNVAGGSGRWNTNAGTVDLSAPNGTLRVANSAHLDGAAASDAVSGNLHVDVEGLVSTTLRGFNAQLDEGGFFKARSFRTRGTDGWTVTADTRIAAARIDLMADRGPLDVQGILDASGARGGFINLISGTLLSVGDDAQLLARSTGGYLADTRKSTVFEDGYRGGRVYLGAPSGSVDLGGGVIDVSGTRADGDGHLLADSSGTVRVTAQRNSSNDGVQIGVIESQFRGAQDIQVVGHQRYDASALTTVVSDSSAFTAQAANILATLFEPDASAPANLRVVPGIEIDAAGDLNSVTLPGTTSATTGLFASSIGAGVLSFRASGNLSVANNALLRDGLIVQRVQAVNRFIADTDHSWSLQLVAGADLDSPDLLATAGAGNLSIGSGAALMTGDGDIDLAAAGDIALGPNAKVLVVGRQFTQAKNGGLYNFDGTINIPGAVAANLQFLRGASFPDVGGYIDIGAGGKITGAASPQFVREWMLRMGDRQERVSTASEPANPLGIVPRAWGLAIGPAEQSQNAVAFSGVFNQGIGAWGGGNVDITAGDDIEKIQVNIPTVGRQIGVNSWAGSGQAWITSSDIVDEIGGGIASITAAGSIRGVDVFVARGDARLQAGHDIATFDDVSETRANRFALGDTTVELQAGGRVDVGSVVNQTTLQLPNTHPLPRPGLGVFYFSYTPRAALRINALGDVAILNLSGLPVATAMTENLYPGHLDILSANGDIDIRGTLKLFGNSTDGFVFAARGSVGGGGGLAQLDLLPSFFPSFDQPARLSQFPDLTDEVLSASHSSTPVYAGDRTPNLVLARDGRISDFQATTAKRLVMFAGEDIRDVELTIQQANAGDISLLDATRDIVMSSDRGPAGALLKNNFGVSIAGPGEGQLLAGGRIDFGTALGARSVGNLANPALDKHGADLTLVAGVGRDLPGLLDFAIDTYLDKLLVPFASASIDRISAAPTAPVPTDKASGAVVSDNFRAFLRANDALVKLGRTAEQLNKLSETTRLAVKRALIVDEFVDGLVAKKPGSFGERVAALARFAAPWNKAAPSALLLSHQTAGDVLISVDASDLDAADHDQLDLAIGDLVYRHAELGLFLQKLTRQQSNTRDGQAQNVASNLARLRALEDSQQLSFMLDLMYSTVTRAGAESAEAASGHFQDYNRGYLAINSFFPGAEPQRKLHGDAFVLGDLGYRYAGDISSTLSSVQTQGGGTIRVAAPGGSIDVGATKNDAIGNKADKDLGYIAFRSGDIKVIVNDDFNVNSTRVFAQNGGDVLVWSSLGDIDAGRGAKTAATIPATVAVFDAFGNFVDEPPLAVSGSGIRNFAPADVAPGTLYLFAPKGVINAGDAGIGSAGNLVIAANEILGADNFDVGGQVTGSLGAATTSIAVGLTGVGDVAASATKATEKATADAAQRDAAAQNANALSQPMLSILSVEVLGFGADGSASDPEDKKKKRR